MVTEMKLINSKTLDECFFQIRNGANIKQGVIEGGFPITRIETIANDVFNRDRMGYAGINELDKYKDYVLEDGDLLMSHINSEKYLGRTVIYKKQDNEIIIHGMNLLGLKANRSIIIPDYAKYFFYSNFFRGQIANITKKSVNQASFSVSDLKKLNILVPSLSDQHKIVATLDQVNDLITLRNQQLEQLDLLIKSRFVEMFGDPVKNEKGWIIKELQSISKVGSSKRFYQEELCNSGVPFLKIADILNKIDNKITEISTYISEEQYAELLKQNLVPKENDVLVTSRGTIGKCYIISKDDKFYFQDGMITWLSNFDKYLSPIFIYYSFMMNGIRNQINIMQAGSTVAYLSIAMIKKLNIIVPPLALQKQFADFVQQVDKAKASIKKSLEQFETLKKKLMQDYFG